MTPRPQSAHLAQRIRAQIHEGGHPPGAHLSEYALADAFGTSRTPVRHALQLLAQEDLVVYREHRGYVVREMSPHEVQARLRVRAAMEGLAARVVAARGLTVTERALIRGCLAECRDMSPRLPDPTALARYLDAVRAFHEVLRHGANNALLAQTIARSLYFPFTDPQSGAVRWVEHEALVTARLGERIVPAAVIDRGRIVEAMEEGNGQRAEALLREHMFSISRAVEELASSSPGVQPLREPSASSPMRQ